MSDRSTGPLGKFVLILFCMFWVTLVSVFDVRMAWVITKQTLAMQYPTTVGGITRSQAVCDGGGKSGPSFRFDVEYQYQVAGIPFVGTRYRYGAGSAGGDWAARASAQFPAGQPATVHYRADDPKDAVLSTGLQGTDLFILMFLNPFNAFALGIVVGFCSYVLGRNRVTPETLQTHARRIGTRTHLRLPVIGFWTTFLSVLALTSFFTIFIVGIPCGFDPSLNLMLFVWSALLFGSLAVACYAGLHHTDLIFDEFSDTVTLPATYGRKSPTTFPRRDAVRVETSEVEQTNKNGEVAKALTVAVVFKQPNGEEYTAQLYEELYPQSADAIAEWLRSTLKI